MVRLVQLRSIASLALQLAILGALIAAFFVRMPQVSGLSMAPHISSGEYVVINTLAYRFATPARGDIVAFRHTADAPEVYIKRVIGLPGDRIRIDGGIVYVNGAKLDEPYVHFHDDRSFPEVTVPAESVYVLGDNRANSEDSRFFGPVADRDLTGRALMGIWPLSDLGRL
ncbi:MAG TPA: signal peptidase I [Candidatus Aquilonibacter sp.]|nr:signal peptidase I [Candidatus Aquilonibacter sp.]